MRSVWRAPLDRAILAGMVRILLLLATLAVAGLAALAVLGPPPSRQGGAPPERPSRSAGFQAPAGRALATPFGDALFRWRCTTGLLEALGERPDWPTRRVAELCLCAADRLREDGPRDIVVGSGDLAQALSAAESRLCRPR